jgi:hypothetical protein
MTGEKNRYSTVEKLWKFDDETLKTPKHDELVLWLLNRDNFLSVFPTIGYSLQPGAYINEYKELMYIHKKLGNEKFWTSLNGNKSGNDIPEECQEYWSAALLEYRKLSFDAGAFFLPSATLEYTAKSEVPILTGREFIVGYWDLIVEVHAPRVKEFFSKSKRFSYSILYRDDQKNYMKAYVEVKPKIDSFGATLRQLRTYQEYERSAAGNTYLFTPDLRFKDAFESQGIKVISPP